MNQFCFFFCYSFSLSEREAEPGTFEDPATPAHSAKKTVQDGEATSFSSGWGGVCFFSDSKKQHEAKVDTTEILTNNLIADLFVS